MKRMKEIQISIKGIAGRKGEYVAYYRSEFGSPFSVYVITFLRIPTIC